MRLDAELTFSSGLYSNNMYYIYYIATMAAEDTVIVEQF